MSGLWSTPLYLRLIGSARIYLSFIRARRRHAAAQAPARRLMALRSRGALAGTQSGWRQTMAAVTFPRLTREVAAQQSGRKRRFEDERAPSGHGPASRPRRQERSPSKLRQTRTRPFARRDLGPTGRTPPTRAARERVLRKRAKAAKRQEKHVRKLRAAVGDVGLLESLAVGAGTRADYARRRNAFYTFAAKMGLSISSEPDLDIALCEYGDARYLDGEACDVGLKLLSALEEVHPVQQRKGWMHLPRFRRSLKGWRKAAPTGTRLPVTEECMWAVCGELLCRGLPDMALANALQFSAYLRPSEMLELCTCDLIAPAEEARTTVQEWVLLLAPVERGVPTKGGGYDETVPLDDVRAPELGELMGERQAAAREMAGVTEDNDEGQVLMWPFRAKEFGERWRAAVATLKLDFYMETPYQNRHGGLSRDLAMKLRDRANAQRRGRWAVDTTVRNYDKAGRLQDIMRRVPKGLADYADTIKKNFSRFVRGGMAPKFLEEKVGTGASSAAGGTARR